MRNITNRIAAAIVFAVSVMGFVWSPAVAKPVSAVLELFTSQGCSSCPPADALLHKFAERDDVLALSLPVDYWDNLGWKDTLGSPVNSQRQRDYAHRRGDRSVYTPQIVVNGLTHVAGYNEREINRAIDATSQFLRAEKVSLRLNTAGEILTVMISKAGADAKHRSGTVWLLLYSKLEEVSIGSGENAGRKLSYVNVVREMTPVGMWNGEENQFALPKTAIMNRGHEGCAVLLQAENSGPILAAATLDSW